MDNKYKWLIVIVIILFPNPFTNVHGNTDKAYDWCADGNSDVGKPSCSGALGKCIDDYMVAHNLTESEFPTYVWLNAGYQYEKLFLYDYFNIFKIMITVGFVIYHIKQKHNENKHKE